MLPDRFPSVYDVQVFVGGVSLGGFDALGPALEQGLFQDKLAAARESSIAALPPALLQACGDMHTSMTCLVTLQYLMPSRPLSDNELVLYARVVTCEAVARRIQG